MQHPWHLGFGLYMTRTPVAILVWNWEEGANEEREKRVTPEFGERKEEKIPPPNSGRYSIYVFSTKEGRTVQLWHDLWNQRVPRFHCLELYSFATSTNLIIYKCWLVHNISDIFQLLLSLVAYKQFLVLEHDLDVLPQHDMKEIAECIYVEAIYVLLQNHTSNLLVTF
jgi:hypothetical protein